MARGPNRRSRCCFGSPASSFSAWRCGVGRVFLRRWSLIRRWARWWCRIAGCWWESWSYSDSHWSCKPIHLRGIWLGCARHHYENWSPNWNSWSTEAVHQCPHSANCRINWRGSLSSTWKQLDHSCHSFWIWTCVCRAILTEAMGKAIWIRYCCYCVWRCSIGCKPGLNHWFRYCSISICGGRS